MNLPNTITLIRIALIPLFMASVPADGRFGLLPVVIFAVASLTDGLDGAIARKYNLVTTFGKFIDPLADKLLVTAALLIFTARGQMPVWAVMVILAREFIVTSLRLVVIDSGVVMAAALSGKIKTAVQIVCILLMMTPFALYAPAGILLNDIAVWVMVLVTVWSGADYLISHRGVLRK